VIDFFLHGLALMLSNGGPHRNKFWQKGSLVGEDDARMSNVHDTTLDDENYDVCYRHWGTSSGQNYE